MQMIILTYKSGKALGFCRTNPKLIETLITEFSEIKTLSSVEVEVPEMRSDPDLGKALAHSLEQVVSNAKSLAPRERNLSEIRDLSTRTKQIFAKMGLKNLSDVQKYALKKGWDSFLCLPNFGKKSLREIQMILIENNYSIQLEPTS